MAMGRKKPKDHGKPADKYFVGAPRGRVVLVEDTTTTGASLLKQIKNVKLLPDAHIVAAYGVTNRMERRADGKSVQEAIEEQGVQYLHMSRAPELLPLVYQKQRPSDELAEKVEAEFREHGLEPLKLR